MPDGNRRLTALSLGFVVVLSVLTPSLAVGGVAAAANDGTIESCTTIDESGTYELTGDISTSESFSCIEVTASDVTIDGNGNSITNTAEETSETVGVRVRSGEEGEDPAGVTIENLDVTGWGTGIVVDSGEPTGGEEPALSVRSDRVASDGAPAAPLWPAVSRSPTPIADVARSATTASSAQVADTITVSGVTVEGGRGLDIFNDGKVEVSDVTVSGTTGGVNIEATTGSVEGLTVTDASPPEEPFLTQGAVELTFTESPAGDQRNTVTDLTVENSGFATSLLVTDTTDLSLSGVEVSDGRYTTVLEDAAVIVSGSQNVDMTDTTVTNSGTIGIAYAGSSGEVTGATVRNDPRSENPGTEVVVHTPDPIDSRVIEPKSTTAAAPDSVTFENLRLGDAPLVTEATVSGGSLGAGPTSGSDITPPDGWKFTKDLLFGFDLEGETSTIELSVEYDDSEIPSAVAESSLRFWKSTGGGEGTFDWTEVSSEPEVPTFSGTLEPGESLALLGQEPGTGEISVDSLSTNSPVQPGETLTTTATLTNPAEEGYATQQVQLEVDGEVIEDATTTVTLGPGDSKEVPLDWVPTRADAGDHDVTVSTGSDSASTTVTVDGNEPPTASDDSYTTAEGERLFGIESVLANDDDPNGDSLSATVTDGPANGQVTLNDDGSFSYLPEGDFVGEDTFTYRVSDGQGGTDTATVTVEVVPDTVGDDDETEGDGGGDETPTATPSPTPSPTPTQTPAPTQTPSGGTPTPGETTSGGTPSDTTPTPTATETPPPAANTPGAAEEPEDSGPVSGEDSSGGGLFAGPGAWLLLLLALIAALAVGYFRYRQL